MKEKRCVDDFMMNNQMVNTPYMNDQMQVPIYECPCERVCHREICHEVKHVKPVHTRIINHHIYHHTCTPCFTCSEENEICNVYDDSCKCR